MHDPRRDLWVLCRNGPAIEEAEVDTWLLRRLDGLESAGVCERANLWRVARLEGDPAGWDGWLLEIRGQDEANDALDGLLEDLRLLGLNPRVLRQGQGAGSVAPASVPATGGPR